MAKYHVMCPCDDAMTVEADSLEEAKAKLKEMMTPEAIAAHMAEKHEGEGMKTKEEIDAMIDSGTQEMPA